VDERRRVKDAAMLNRLPLFEAPRFPASLQHMLRLTEASVFEINFIAPRDVVP